VVAYRVAPLTRWLLLTLRLLKIDLFALPNLLAGTELVPELLQDEVRPERLGHEVLRWLDDERARGELEQAFERIHEQLRQDANDRAAQAVIGLCAGAVPGRQR
jgi:lipid-A-disaccharide synthase